jgi:hypothetical protein
LKKAPRHHRLSPETLLPSIKFQPGPGGNHVPDHFPYFQNRVKFSKNGADIDWEPKGYQSLQKIMEVEENGESKNWAEIDAYGAKTEK